MAVNIPSNDSICPMCGKIPEDLELKNHEYFVWNPMTECYICESCDLELGIEYDEEDSRYFKMSSSLLGLDVTECKKRYRELVINATVH